MPEQLVVTDRPFNAGTPLNALLEDLTPIQLAFVRNHFSVPELEATEWELSIGGLVDRKLQLGMRQIRDRSPIRFRTVFECAGNGRTRMDPIPEGTPWGLNAASLVEFAGTPLAGVLEEAGLDGTATEIVFRGADRGTTAAGREESYARSLPISVAMRPDTLLAWEMNGQPLTVHHGSPLRLVVPGWYGMASVKWLQSVEVVDRPFLGFFQADHYLYRDERGLPDATPVSTIRVRSLIVSPEDQAEIGAGEVVLEGIAWSGNAEVVQVELSFDGGTQWIPAKHESPATVYGASRWRYEWTPSGPGAYVIKVRATDASGEIQPTRQVWNRLGYGNNGVHSIQVRVF